MWEQNMPQYELDKNHQVSLNKDQEKWQIMHAMDGDENCPIKSLKLYLSKLNCKCPFLFQKPKSSVVPSCPIWYENKPIGVHKLDSIMKHISAAVGLSQQYTNHYLRATATTILSNAGLDSHKIMSVTGH